MRALAVPLLASLGLLVSSPGTAQQQPGPDVRPNINDDCIEGFNWPTSASVDVTVRDSGGSVLHRFNDVPVDSDSHFGAGAQPGGFCDRPVDLQPGMEVTATDGDTTKVVVLRRVTYDELDPDTDVAAGTAPAGRLFISVFTEGPNAYQEIDDHPGGRWSVDFGALGVDVKVGSGGDVFASDDDGDSTVADHFVTAVSLQASVPAEAGAAVRVARGTEIRLQGRLSAGERACVKRKRVRLVKVSGKHQKSLRSGRTNRRGRYSFDRTVKKTTSFRVDYRGNVRCQRSKSRVRQVKVSG